MILCAIVLSGIIALLGVGFNNQKTMVKHNSAQGPHGEIGVDIATIQTDVAWIRKKLDHESPSE